MKQKDRKWVKWAAIGFAVVMLILTFFSNTIMNATLTEVTAKRVVMGTISPEIRGDGVTESAGVVTVKADTPGVVTSVSYSVGQSVWEGLAVMMIEPKDDGTLLMMKESLAEKQTAYTRALLEAGISQSNASEMKRLSAELEKAQSDLKKAKEFEGKAKSLDGEVTKAEQALAKARKEYDSKTAEARAALQKAEYAAADAETAKINAETNAEYYRALLEKERAAESEKPAASEPASESEKPAASEPAPESEKPAASEPASESEKPAETPKASAADTEKKLKEAEEVLKKREAALLAAQNALFEAQKTYNAAERKAQPAVEKAEAALAAAREKRAALNEKYAGVPDSASAQSTVLSIQGQIEAAKNASAAEAVNGEIADLELDNQKKAIDELLAKIAETEEKLKPRTITAPAEGVLSELSLVPGQEYEAGTVLLAVNEAADKYTLRFPAPVKDAERAVPGSTAFVVNAEGGDYHATLREVVPSAYDPTGTRDLVFDITGFSAAAGQYLSISLPMGSAEYKKVIPLQAIYRDNTGTYVFAVTSKSSPLGTRSTVARVAVEILDQDSSYAAVEGDISDANYVVTLANGPLGDGQRVRLGSGGGVG